MNLDDQQHLAALDESGMLHLIDGLPEQFENAWHTGLAQPLPDHFHNIKQVVIASVGASAIGGDILAALMEVNGRVPVHVCHTYDLPAWAKNDDTLVIVSSVSGNHEEVLSAYAQATERGLPILAITTGGKLAEQVKNNTAHILWQFNHNAAPRTATGWSLGLLLALAHRLEWLPDLAEDVIAAAADMREHREIYRFDTPTTRNPAKRQAGQWVERIPVIYGGGVFAVVAHHLKNQLNENGKMVAMYEPLPECNYNTIAGIEFPTALMTKITALFIRSRHYDHPRVNLRHKLTFKLFLQNGIAVDTFRPHGDSLLAQVMHAIQYGDYVSFYAALGNGIDPTIIMPIDEIKDQMAVI